MHRMIVLTFTIWIAAVGAASAAVEFVRDVQPIFREHCYTCHGENKQKNGLRLDIRSQAFKGGDEHGASILPGKPDESPLIQAVLGGVRDVKRMPFKGERLSAREIETLSTWVAEGAVWPEGADHAKLEDRRDHWSFKPVQAHRAPEVSDPRWPRNEIDRFILAMLERNDLRPSAETDRVTWLRRVTLDLTGLPPTPQQAQAFLSDPCDARMRGRQRSSYGS